MIGAVDQLDLEIDDREAGHRASLHCDFRPFSTPRMYSFGIAPPTNLAFEHVALARVQRLYEHLDARELARTAGLLLVRVVDIGFWVIVSR